MIISFVRIVSISVISAVFSSLSIISLLFNRHGKGVKFFTKTAAKLVLYTSGVKSEITGTELLNPNERYLFISNHQSYYDIPVLIDSIPNDIRFVYKKSLTWIPFFGWFLYLTGYIPINRKEARSALKSLHKAAKSLVNGRCIAIFPEGTRSNDGNIHDFKKGMFIIAKEAKQKIVPVTISGTRKILPKKSLRIRPGKVKVTISTPLDYKEDKNFLEEIRTIIINNFQN